MSTLDRPLDRLRRPEYTGENRCLPCTILNVIIAVVITVMIGAVWPPAGALVLGASLAVIYLRGYLVPGTPTITQRYLPARVLRAFGKEPERVTRHAGTTSGDAPPTNEELTGPATDSDDGTTDVDKHRDGHPESATEETTPEESSEKQTSETTSFKDGHDEENAERDLETLLRSAGVVEECENEDDLCLTDRFASAWWRRIRQVREDEQLTATRLAATIDVDPEELEFESRGQRYVVTYEGDRIGLWDSDAAFYSDLAAEPTLDEWISEWDDLSDQTRTQLIAGIRAFLESCPSCESPLEQVENVRKTCCSSQTVGVDVDCAECGVRVFSGRY